MGARFYPPPGSLHYKLLQLGDYNIGVHRGTFRKDTSWSLLPPHFHHFRIVKERGEWYTTYILHILHTTFYLFYISSIYYQFKWCIILHIHSTVQYTTYFLFYKTLHISYTALILYRFILVYIYTYSRIPTVIIIHHISLHIYVPTIMMSFLSHLVTWYISLHAVSLHYDHHIIVRMQH